MKCFETDKLICYAYRLMDEAEESQVRAHLGKCARCRQIVRQHGRLVSLLDEWKAVGPSPEFDVHIRQAIEAQQSERFAWGFWGLGWTRGLALVSLGVLIIAGVVWHARGNSPVSSPSRVAAIQKMKGGPAPAQAAMVQQPAVAAHARVKPADVVPEPGQAVAVSAEEKDAQALDDYDLAANFDVLSELRKGESKVVN